MGTILKLNLPSLGGKLKHLTGSEPGLSAEHRPLRQAEVARLVKVLNSKVTHERFNAVLALADYADHPRAVAAILRTMRDEVRLLRLAAIFALGIIAPTLTNDMLRRHAISVLRCTMKDVDEVVIRWVAIHTLAADRSWQQCTAGRALAAELLPRVGDGRTDGSHRELRLADCAAAALAAFESAHLRSGK